MLDERATAKEKILKSANVHSRYRLGTTSVNIQRRNSEDDSGPRTQGQAATLVMTFGT